MGDYFKILVPERVMISEEEARASGKRMLAWMQGQGWVGETSTGGYLFHSEVYPLTRKATEIIRREDLVTFAWAADHIGVEEESAFGILAVEVADTLKVVHHSGQGGFDSAYCPKCGEDIGDDIFELIDIWWNAEGNPELPCPLCEGLSPINKFRMEPAWGFSNLSFHFWGVNGRFNETFIAAFTKELGEPARLVSGKL